MATWTPPFPLCSASQEGSFAHESTVKRWPILLNDVVNEVEHAVAALFDSSFSSSDRIKASEGTEIVRQVKQLAVDILAGAELSCLEPAGLPDDYTLYNSQIETLKNEGQGSWLTAPWLFAECYLYRRLRLVFSRTTQWTLFDPFQTQKVATWRSSATGAAALARSLQALHASGPLVDSEKAKVDFLNLAKACLWGNATDLSLLTNLSHDEIKQLQSVERGQHFLLKNDFAAVWEHLSSLEAARIDFVLDNSGFELFTDLVLADWLVSLSSHVSEVVIHPKLIPWFVSDVQPHDFVSLLASLKSPSSFFGASSGSGLSAEDEAALAALGERWQGYVESGKFKLSVPTEYQMGEQAGETADFWTSPLPFPALPTAAPSLLTNLKKSSLVLFKGDLNYRKLVGDALWPTTTSFSDALGPLAGHFPLLSLRTIKADSVVGLAPGVPEAVEKIDPRWRYNGKYAVVSFAPKMKL
ncbi:hypothetical protein JCM8547_003613 [Rhodosporidiobolus lusitaniae]